MGKDRAVSVAAALPALSLRQRTVAALDRDGCTAAVAAAVYVRAACSAAAKTLQRRPQAGGAAADVETVLGNVCSAVVQRHGVADDAITVEAAADGPFVVAGQTADVEIVIRNLLDNAVKYSLPDPRVTVTISRTNAGRVRIAVADNGPGIPIPLRPLNFRRFHRLGSELERSTPGTGLGLFLVKSLVRQMRGKVLVRGRQPPPGTVFEVELPAAPPA